MAFSPFLTTQHTTQQFRSVLVRPILVDLPGLISVECPERLVMHKLRVYVDTSVIGGTQDEEFAGPSERFFERVCNGQYVLLVSPTTISRHIG